MKFSKETVKYTRKTLLEISQMKAAKALGVSFSTWQAYEYGRFRMPLSKWKRWLEIVAKGGKKNGKAIKNKRALV